MRATPELLKDIDAGRVDLVSLFASDLELYAQLALKIQTKAGTLTSFLFNDAQQVLHQWCEEQLGAQKKIRAVLLKARQYGGTTYIASRIFRNTAMRANQHAKIVAQSDEAVGKLLEMYQRYYNFLPEGLRPLKKYQSKSELTFANPVPAAVAKEPGLNSSLGIYSAKSRSAGRGSTLRYLHCSEVAFWDAGVAEKLMLGLLNTVPSSDENSVGTEVFLESTANGMGDYFHKKYLKAKAEDDGDFRAIFIPWYLHSEYRAMCRPNFEAALNPTERDLFSREHEDWAYVNPATGKKSLSLEQLCWRRIALATLCDGDLHQFQQEYPLTDEEAFVTSGKSFFPLEKIQERMKALVQTKPLLFRGDIEEVEDKKEEVAGAVKRRARRVTKKKIKLTEDELGGQLYIFEKPTEGQKYVWFADVAEGVEGGDLSEVHVLNQKTGFQAAVWRGSIDPDSFGDICFMIGQHYHWARGTPEAQNHGLVTLMRLKERHYPFLYRRQVYDDMENQFKDQEGWMTTKRTRPVMLEALRSNFRENAVIVNDPETLGQMQTFVMVRGKLQAMDGSHDDAVMGLAGACQMKDELPMPNEKRTRNYLDKQGDKEGYYRREAVKRAKRKPSYDLVTGALQ